MQVNYIIEATYANGDKYADKVGSFAEVANIVKFINSDINATRPDDERITTEQFSITTEEA